MFGNNNGLHFGKSFCFSRGRNKNDSDRHVKSGSLPMSKSSTSINIPPPSSDAVERLTVQLVSDMHLELINSRERMEAIIPRAIAPVLVMAGDIYVGRRTDFYQVMEMIARRFEAVVYVPGNHEYYSGDGNVKPMEQIHENIVESCKKIKNFHLLDNSSVVINGITFFGGTMWVEVPAFLYPAAKSLMNDFNIIGTLSYNHVRSLSPEDMDTMHHKTVSYMEDRVRSAKGGTVDRENRQRSHQTRSPIPASSYYNPLRQREKIGTYLHDKTPLLSKDSNTTKPTEGSVTDDYGGDGDDFGNDCDILVAVTHHAPSFKHAGNWFRSDIYKDFYFANDVDSISVNPPVVAWMHGHTHAHTNDINNEGTMILSNARGYDHELNPEYNENMLITFYSDGTVVVKDDNMKSRLY